ncbi:hypothetical protein GCM10011374_03280 [Kocuria dechangensis]|uniref:Uncharacterized protein n=1 Tax=Kocuria dechangensis TaxID=1176249 RepID=A0A917GFS4_9MICC|nr:hypothetical protein [Kocuria dechangensis]GGG44304.1 hypothetical protein GCM10011374_03280 [Kocuria dechangensis]
MEISTSSTADLKQHLTEIAAEQEHRRNTGERGAPGGNGYIKAMSDESLRDHQLYILRETTRRESSARHHAYFTK